MSAMVIIVVVACVLATGIFVYKGGLVPKSEPKPGPENSVGKDTDEHGCLIAAGYSWCEVKQKCLRSWEEDCITSEEPEINFTKTGTLVNFETQAEEKLALVYEEAGKPDLIIFLDFTEESICVDGDEDWFCLDADLKIGSRVTVEGEKAENSDRMTVVTLTVVE